MAKQWATTNKRSWQGWFLDLVFQKYLTRESGADIGFTK